MWKLPLLIVVLIDHSVCRLEWVKSKIRRSIRRKLECFGTEGGKKMLRLNGLDSAVKWYKQYRKT